MDMFGTVSSQIYGANVGFFLSLPVGNLEYETIFIKTMYVAI